MRSGLEKEIKAMLADFKRWEIDHLKNHVDSLQRQVYCLKGWHTPVLKGNELACNHCAVVTGKVVSPTAVTKKI